VEDRIAGLLDSQRFERVAALRESMQQLMTEQCSVFRDGKSLQEALIQIRKLQRRCLNVGLKNKSRIFNYELQEALELSNMLKVAEAIVYSALMRTESRGAHFRSDFPERNDEEWLKHTLIAESPTGLKECYKPVALGRFEPQKRRY
jgi:succinate dehydrogenase / fumarate reductase, flavoprotein subunit